MTLHVHTAWIDLESPANGVVTPLNEQVAAVVAAAPLRSGALTLFSPSATSAITTLEYEPGAVSDLQRLFEEVAAQHRQYIHNDNHRDGNGHAHVRAALFGPSLTIPFVDGLLTLGYYQEIVFLDFDNRPRSRRIVAQLVGA